MGKQSHLVALIDEQKRKIMDIVEQPVPDCRILIDLEGRIVEANRCFCELMGFEKPEVTGKNILDFIPDDLYGMFRSRLETLAEEGTSECDLPFLDKTKEEVPLWCKAMALYNEKGKYSYAILVMRDLTERKMAEDRLLEKFRESEEKMSVIWDRYNKLSEIFQRNMDKNFELRDDLQFLEYLGSIRSQSIGILVGNGQPQDKIDELLTLFRDLLKAEIGFLYLFETDKKRYFNLTSTELDITNFIHQVPSMLTPYGKSGKVSQVHKKMQQSEIMVYMESEHLPIELKEELNTSFNTTKGIALFPMTIKGKLIGLMGFKTMSRPLFTDDKTIEYLRDIIAAIGLFIELNFTQLALQRKDDDEVMEAFILRTDSSGKVLNVSQDLLDNLEDNEILRGHANVLDLVKEKYRQKALSEFFEAIAGLKSNIIVPIQSDEPIFYKLQPYITEWQGINTIEFRGHRIDTIGG